MRLDKKKMIAATIVACTTLFIAIGIHEKKDTRKQLKFGATYMTMNNPCILLGRFICSVSKRKYREGIILWCYYSCMFTL